MHLQTPKKLETGKYISTPRQEIGIVSEAFYYNKWYISKQTQDEMNKLRNLCIGELVTNSSRWFTKQMTEASVQQRFQQVTNKWIDAPTGFPTWGYEMYPYEAFNIGSAYDLSKYNGCEVSVRFVLDHVVLTPTTFYVVWGAEQIYDLIEKIAISEETSPPADKIEIAQDEDNVLEVVTDFAETTDTKIIKLNRDANDERRKRKGDIIRADIRNLMEKLRAKQEEYDYYESYQHDTYSSSDESEMNSDDGNDCETI